LVAEAKRILKPGGILIVGDPWMPIYKKGFTQIILAEKTEVHYA
jgi:hypothetical protein